MALTIEQIRQIAALIEDYHLGFALRVVGFGATGASEADVNRLVALGILSPDEATRLGQLDAFRDATNLSILRQHAEDLVGPARSNAARAAVNSLSWDALRDHIKANPIPMDARQRAAVEWAATSAGERIIQRGRAVSAKMVSDALGQHSSASTVETMTKEATVRAIREGLARRKLASDLGWASRNWDHDWQRVARTELQEADNRGTAATIADRHGDEADVARVPNPDACDDCERLFLDGDGNPIIWKLAELAALGDNVGRKRAEWTATLSTVHPNCHCRTRRVPRGFTFGPDRQLYARGTVPTAAEIEAEFAEIEAEIEAGDDGEGGGDRGGGGPSGAPQPVAVPETAAPQ